MTEKTVGIIGGMGPEAAVDFQNRIIRHTRVTDDAGHIHCLVDNNPKIPSRIAHILDQTGEDPGPFISNMAKGLERWGADFIAIPCNTAHYYYDRIQQAVSIPVLNLIDLVVEAVVRMNPGERVGVLGSTAIIKTGLYDNKFKNLGIQTVYPDGPVQQELFDLIRSIKAGDVGESSKKRFAGICAHMVQKKTSLAIIACTELGIISGGTLPMCLVDAADILAQKVVSLALSDSGDTHDVQ